ncbi:CPBP family intramembrane metalloprotease [Salicibibacter halophilus]|uniref:CPBP family intramembrane metalloprotease n=1 Tax=Salicibibacter halophilus TaxID=2502791 RepID=A0A514LHH1_9BACI|nr:type II CAAX endopeptidase family protein [Salicibibacter halophilus]QDI90985.1 CPBP family intramembrane metalloprotease [Salicibibacter halophilus]
MMETTNARLLTAIWQGFGFMVLAGLLLTVIFRWGEVLPFLAGLFQPEFVMRDVLIGLGSGVLMAGIVTLLMKITNIDLPDNDLTQLLKKIIRARGGIVTIALGAGVAEEFLFRGVLMGLVVDEWNTALVLILNALVFAALHVPQYKGKILMHVVVFIMGIWLGALFLLSYTLWAPIAAHALYNAILGWQMRAE